MKVTWLVVLALTGLLTAGCKSAPRDGRAPDKQADTAQTVSEPALPRPAHADRSISPMLDLPFGELCKVQCSLRLVAKEEQRAKAAEDYYQCTIHQLDGNALASPVRLALWRLGKQQEEEIASRLRGLPHGTSLECSVIGYETVEVHGLPTGDDKYPDVLEDIAGHGYTISSRFIAKKIEWP